MPTKKETETDPSADPQFQGETREQAQQRAQSCYSEIQRVVAASRCKIVPFTVEEKTPNGTLIVRASYGVVPE